MVQHAERPDDVEALVAERTREDVGLDDVTVRPAGEMAVRDVDAAREIDADDLRAVLGRDLHVTAEAAADVEDAPPAELLEGERVAEVALEIRPPLRDELGTGETEVETLAREAFERVGERVVDFDHVAVGEQLRMLGEEARMTCAHACEERWCEQARNARDDGKRRGAGRAAQRALRHLALAARRAGSSSRYTSSVRARATTGADDQTEERSLHEFRATGLPLWSQGEPRVRRRLRCGARSSPGKTARAVRPMRQPDASRRRQRVACVAWSLARSPWRRRRAGGQARAARAPDAALVDEIGDLCAPRRAGASPPSWMLEISVRSGSAEARVGRWMT